MNIMEIIRTFGLGQEETLALYEYLKNPFTLANENACADTRFLAPWKRILCYGGEHGASCAINELICPKNPVSFLSPERIRMELYPSFAGLIPILYVENQRDFECLVTNAVYKGNPPANLSQIGATFVFGKTTRFIILSAKPYSNVAASELGLSEDVWMQKSMILRREHECTHYFTKQVFGVSRLHLQDELIADFFGIYEAFGFYCAEWFQRFMGVLGTSDGRLSFYTSGIGGQIFEVVKEITRLASEKLEKYSRSEEFRTMGREQRVIQLCRMDLSTLCGWEEDEPIA